MAKPLAAIVGRPNVGKSTLINRLAASGHAIVDKISGVTRDRNYIEADWRGVEFTLVDTGGLETTGDQQIAMAIKDQALAAVDEADLVLFVVDGKSGLLPDDHDIADILRKRRKPRILVVNKLDNPADTSGLAPFYKLGLGEPQPVSAAQGLMVGDLLDTIVDNLPEMPAPPAETDETSVAIVGRPNSGKSSILNSITGDQRAMVSEVPGTTRDAIDTVVKAGENEYRFIDTAGLRRLSKLSGNLEYYGILRAIKALENASVALFVVDSEVGVTYQDQRIARLAGEKKCALIILLNKWDLIDTERAEEISADLVRKLGFVDWAIVIKTSATTGRGLKKLFTAIDQVRESFERRISTPELNKFLFKMKKRHLPTKRGKSLKLRYATQLDASPPTFLIFVNDPKIADDAYKRFLDKNIRDEFDLIGTPLNFYFRKGEKR
ncbi:MAG: ribosome biogenesis GTPase Der [Actinomycetia bacterium]|nr:ribosome biogenesis GTPase Der [Actinomycetes bacterium]